MATFCCTVIQQLRVIALTLCFLAGMLFGCVAAEGGGSYLTSVTPVRPSLKAQLCTALGPTYTLPHGRQVSFYKQSGTWRAHVVDAWLRVQDLPVVGSPGRSLEASIASLEDKTPREHRSGVHVLEKTDSPSLKGLVYVGPLGVRGGGNVGSSDHDWGERPSLRGHLSSDSDERFRVRSERVHERFPSRSAPPASTPPSYRESTPPSMGTTHWGPPAHRSIGFSDWGERPSLSVHQSVGAIPSRSFSTPLSGRAQPEHTLSLASHLPGARGLGRFQEQSGASVWTQRRIRTLDLQAQKQRDAVRPEAELPRDGRPPKHRGEMDSPGEAEALTHNVDYERATSDHPRPIKDAKEAYKTVTLTEDQKDSSKTHSSAEMEHFMKWRKERRAWMKNESATCEEDQKPAASTSIPSAEDNAHITTEYLKQVSEDYDKAYAQDTAFQQQGKALKALKAQCKQAETEKNRLAILFLELDCDETHAAAEVRRQQTQKEKEHATLNAQLQIQEEAYHQHPLYQVGENLAVEKQRLRREAMEASQHVITMAAGPRSHVDTRLFNKARGHQTTAKALKEALQHDREKVQRPSTPPRLHLVGSGIAGGVNSASDTAQLVVDIPVLGAKLMGKGAHSLLTGEDKLGIGKTINDARTVLDAFMEQQKYDWEHPKEYQDRMKRAEALRHELEDYEAAFNAEQYHHRKARNIGYWSAEALQAVLGSEIIKGATQGGKAIKCAQTAAKKSGVVGKAVEKIAKESAKPACVVSTTTKLPPTPLPSGSDVLSSGAKVAQVVKRVTKAPSVAKPVGKGIGQASTTIVRVSETRGPTMPQGRRGAQGTKSIANATTEVVQPPPSGMSEALRRASMTQIERLHQAGSSKHVARTYVATMNLSRKQQDAVHNSLSRLIQDDTCNVIRQGESIVVQKFRKQKRYGKEGIKVTEVVISPQGTSTPPRIIHKVEEAVAVEAGTARVSGEAGGSGSGTTAIKSSRKLWTITKPEKSVFHPRFKNIHKVPTVKTPSGNITWWSKDLAGHGGSSWKVFEQRDNGLLWVADADKFGEFLKGKHKGPTGRIIPWKELSGR